MSSSCPELVASSLSTSTSPANTMCLKAFLQARQLHWPILEQSDCASRGRTDRAPRFPSPGFSRTSNQDRKNSLVSKENLTTAQVYYLPLRLANYATSIPRANLLSAGTIIVSRCFSHHLLLSGQCTNNWQGKFTKTMKFRLHITALSVIAPHSRYKVWIKANGEMPFLYGGK